MFAPQAKQIYATLGSWLISFTTGYNMGLTSLILPSVREEGSGFHLTPDQESWFVSISLLMLWLGLTSCSYIMAIIGRKYTLLLTIVPVIICNILYYYARSFAALSVAQLLSAMGGTGCLIGGYYIGEYSSPRLRGLLITARLTWISLGVMSTHIFAVLSISWRNISLIAIVPMILAFGITLTCPESPAWLAAKGKFDECRKSFAWFRGSEENEELEDLIKTQMKQNNINVKQYKSRKDFAEYFLDKSFLKALGICIACSLMIDSSGRQAFVSLCVDISSKILGPNQNALYYVIAFDSFDLVASAASCFLMKKIKRRVLVFSFSPVTLTILFTFCLLSYLTSKGVISSSYTWVSLLFLITYFFLSTLTFIPVCYTILFEVYPYSHKGAALSFQHTFLCLFLFIFLKLTPGFIMNFGAHGNYAINGIFVIAALIAMYSLMPETSGKSLSKIERELKDNTPINEEQLRELNTALRSQESSPDEV